MSDAELNAAKQRAKVTRDSDLSAEALEQVVGVFKKVYRRETGEDFPQDAWAQLERSILAVFESWNNNRAIEYRRIHRIRGLLGISCSRRMPR